MLQAITSLWDLKNITNSAQTHSPVYFLIWVAKSTTSTLINLLLNKCMSNHFSICCCVQNINILMSPHRIIEAQSIHSTTADGSLQWQRFTEWHCNICPHGRRSDNDQLTVDQTPRWGVSAVVTNAPDPPLSRHQINDAKPCLNVNN